MECDRAFGLIEKNKKLSLTVFVPQNWVEVIKKASKKFNVREMKKEDFSSFDHLHTIMSDPKKNGDKQNIKWREIVSQTYKKDDFMKFSYHITRSVFLPPLISENCSALKAGRPKLDLQNLNKCLYSAPLPITYEKWQNLVQLLPYIPPVYHDYYKNMAHRPKTNKKKAKGVQKEKEDQNQQEIEEQDQNQEDKEEQDQNQEDKEEQDQNQDDKEEQKQNQEEDWDDDDEIVSDYDEL